jgi:hypothetical protein
MYRALGSSASSLCFVLAFRQDNEYANVDTNDADVYQNADECTAPPGDCIEGADAESETDVEDEIIYVNPDEQIQVTETIDEQRSAMTTQETHDGSSKYSNANFCGTTSVEGSREAVKRFETDADNISTSSAGRSKTLEALKQELLSRLSMGFSNRGGGGGGRGEGDDDAKFKSIPARREYLKCLLADWLTKYCLIRK